MYKNFFCKVNKHNKKYKLFIKLINFKNEIKIIKKDDLNFKKVFLLGYFINQNCCEFSKMSFTKDKIEIKTDFFNTYPIYFFKKKDELIFGNDVDRICKEIKNIRLNENVFNNYLIFGYEAYSNKTIYEKIERIDRNSNLNFHFKRHEIKVFKKKNRSQNIKQDFLNPFSLKIKNFKKTFNKKKIILPITNGVDSQIIFKHSLKNDLKFDCFQMGKKQSTDHIIGKRTALENNLINIFLKQDFNRYNNKIYKLLKEYSIITAGIGTSSEILFLESCTYLGKKYDVALYGFGGELFRNYFVNKNLFVKNYMTPLSTLNKFIKKDFFYSKYYQFLKKNFSVKELNNFYLNERQSKNVSRRIQVAKEKMIPLNPFLNKDSYMNYKRVKKHNINDRQMLNNFKVLSFKKKSPSINYFEIDKFFKISRSILLELLLYGKKLSCDAFKIDYLVSHIEKDNLSEKDKWFLARILNLLMYLNIRK